MKFFRIPFNPDEDGTSTEARSNRLQKYIHAQSVQDMARLATEISPEVRQIIAANVQALLGYLPPGEFSTSITASKENLQNLLASSMLTGYFMHAMETRMQMDDLFSEGQGGESLTHPETLFGGQSTLLQTEPAEVRVQMDETTYESPYRLDFEPERGDGDDSVQAEGRFLNAQELSDSELLAPELGSHPPEPGSEPGDKLNIQLEINTRMNRAELSRLLRELREFQSDRSSAGEEDADAPHS
ncbi:MAG: hypothetical protein CVV27_05530 [Candidatus Melainabacteria bacterium HGW-Melainabacteria-1]|nr:MAG: hypothetical protein CVV27_05530 [Candidatus Melainabacteria bacterium HGW-Melainabacteria-1]